MADRLLRVSALLAPLRATRWLIPRLPDVQREHPGLELRIVTASTPAEQFGMDVDAVISGPSRQSGWIAKRFLGEARLPVLSPALILKCPLRASADLARHTLLHAATLPEAWPRWLAAVGVPDLRPAGEQVFEHFYFAIQAALEGLGVIMGPVALIADELSAGRLLAPIPEPAARTRGYFFYARAERRHRGDSRPAGVAGLGGPPHGERISGLSRIKTALAVRGCPL